MATAAATATFEPHTKRLFISSLDGRRLAIHQLRTSSHDARDRALAASGFAVERGWVYLPGGQVFRAVLRTTN